LDHVGIGVVVGGFARAGLFDEVDVGFGVNAEKVFACGGDGFDSRGIEVGLVEALLDCGETFGTLGVAFGDGVF
jgi:hypothetical protein